MNERSLAKMHEQDRAMYLSLVSLCLKFTPRTEPSRTEFHVKTAVYEEFS